MNAALLGLDQLLTRVDDAFLEGSIGVPEAAARVALQLQQALACSRAGLWRMQRDEAGTWLLARVAEHDGRSGRAETAPLQFQGDACAPLLQHLAEHGVHASPDCTHDPLLGALADCHLRPAGVRALLAVCVGVEPGLWCVLVCEAADAVRSWTPQECTLLRRCAARIVLHRTRTLALQREARALQALGLPELAPPA
jgi:hypothetical protein